MAARIITSVVGLPLLILVVWIGKIPLQVAIAALAIIGMTEFYNAMSQRHMSVHYIGYVFAVVYYAFLGSLNSDFLMTIITLFMLSILSALVVFHKQVNIMDCAVTLLGFFYVAILLSFIYLVRVRTYGSYFAWLIFICAFGSDTFAYITGKTLGKHKLTSLSPKKTIEGSVGAIVGTTLLAMGYGAIITNFFRVDDAQMLLACGMMGFFGSVFAQFGDLSASAIKRYTGVKDFGKLLPGHGGVLDRFDSVIFTAPAVYIVMLALQYFGVRLG